MNQKLIFNKNSCIEFVSQMSKLGLALLLVVSLLLPTSQGQAQTQMNVYLDQYPLIFAVEPRMLYTDRGGHTMVPFRKLAESIGVDVRWDQQTRTINAQGYEKTVTLTIGQSQAQVDGEQLQLDVAPIVDQGHTLIPLRFFVEVFGATVKWDGENQTVYIQSPPRDMYTMAFYGLGSFEKRHYVPMFNGMAYTWSRITTDGEWITSREQDNEYFWPQPHPDASAEDIIASGQGQGGEAYLMVAAFEHRGEVSAILEDANNTQTAIDGMVERSVEKGLDGILIDFEGIQDTEEQASLKTAYTAFISLLTQKAQQHDLKVVTALPPPNNVYSGYEYAKVADMVDAIYLMAYDYNPRGDGLDHRLPEPMTMVDQGIKQTLEQVPAEKIVLGINVIYETPETTTHKIGLSKRYDLKGVGFWILPGMTDEHIEKMNETVPLHKSS
ncbi:stalk domain-containing protein [Caldalkalibacillus salinus]|uniref:stalk domain-containing protein n=1 Tax=Caldalkalibacillus salinus TaxID=2803787 RepID=UPI0019217BCF